MQNPVCVGVPAAVDENNSAVATPRAHGPTCIAERQRRTPADRDALELSTARSRVGKKRHPFSIGGKERIVSAFGSGQRARLHLIERPNVEQTNAVDIGGVHNISAVGRQCGPRAGIGCGFEEYVHREAANKWWVRTYESPGRQHADGARENEAGDPRHPFALCARPFDRRRWF